MIWRESVVKYSVWLIYKPSGRHNAFRRIIFIHNSVLPTVSLLSQQCAANCLSPVTTVCCWLPLSYHNNVLPTAPLLSQQFAADCLSPVTTMCCQLPPSCHNSVLLTASLLSQQCAANCLSPSHCETYHPPTIGTLSSHISFTSRHLVHRFVPYTLLR